MKKLLLFLLFPILTYAQNVQFELRMYNQDTNEIVDWDNPIEEGQTLRIEVHMTAVGSDDLAALQDTKYLFLDFDYRAGMFSANTDCFSFPAIDNLQDSNPLKEKYDFNGSGYTRPSTLDIKGNYNHWVDNGGYISIDSKNTVRIAVQLSNKSFGDLNFDSALRTVEPIFDMCLTVKPGASTDPVQGSFINLANMENTDGSQITSIINAKDAYPTPAEEAAVFNAKLHFELPDALDPTNFKVTVSEGSMTLETSNSNIYTLDANADVILPNVTLDQVYSLWNLEPIDASYIPDVHTVTDAYRSFKYLTDVGINGTDVIYNNFGLFSADANLNGTFNSADTYALLAYVLGLDIGEGFCLPEQNQDGTWYHGCTATVLYENYTVEKLGAELDIRKTDPTSTNYWNGNFTPTENLLTFDFAFWHHADLDQSHSTTFPANLTSKAAKVGLNLSNKAVATTDLDMLTRIEGNKAILELNHDGFDIVGLQARIKFDSNILELDDITFDTGNISTNFVKDKEGELLFGSLVKDGLENIKRGKAIQITFNMKEQVSNLTGLFYFENTDAVNKDGDKLNLNIK